MGWRGSSLVTWLTPDVGTDHTYGSVKQVWKILVFNPTIENDWAALSLDAVYWSTINIIFKNKMQTAFELLGIRGLKLQ